MGIILKNKTTRKHNQTKTKTKITMNTAIITKRTFTVAQMTRNGADQDDFAAQAQTKAPEKPHFFAMPQHARQHEKNFIA